MAQGQQFYRIMTPKTKRKWNDSDRGTPRAQASEEVVFASIISVERHVRHFWPSPERLCIANTNLYLRTHNRLPAYAFFFQFVPSGALTLYNPWGTCEHMKESVIFLTDGLSRIDLLQLAPRLELLNDGHRRLAVGHQSLSDGLLVIIYAPACTTTLHNACCHHLSHKKNVRTNFGGSKMRLRCLGHHSTPYVFTMVASRISDVAAILPETNPVTRHPTELYRTVPTPTRSSRPRRSQHEPRARPHKPRHPRVAHPTQSYSRSPQFPSMFPSLYDPASTHPSYNIP